MTAYTCDSLLIACGTSIMVLMKTRVARTDLRQPCRSSCRITTYIKLITPTFYHTTCQVQVVYQLGWAKIATQTSNHYRTFHITDRLYTTSMLHDLTAVRLYALVAVEPWQATHHCIICYAIEPWHHYTDCINMYCGRLLSILCTRPITGEAAPAMPYAPYTA
jgi:hypothetical protein